MQNERKETMEQPHQGHLLALSGSLSVLKGPGAAGSRKAFGVDGQGEI